jgi:hypothetical protein
MDTTPAVTNLAQPVSIRYGARVGKTTVLRPGLRLAPPSWVPSRRVRHKMVRLAGRDRLSPGAIQAHYRNRDRFYDIALIRSILQQRGLA